jgi:cytochrome c oxidase subunit 3
VPDRDEYPESRQVNIFQQLTEKPWLTPQGVILEPAIARRTEVPKAKMGLWVFLSVVTVLFFLLIFAYAGRMAFEDWRPGPELGLLWFNTLALLCGSIAMVGNSAARGSSTS